VTMISTEALKQYLSISRKRKLTMWNSVLLFVIEFFVIQHLLFRLFSNAILTAYSHHRFITLIFRLRNDLYCVEWGVKLYSLTHYHFDRLLSGNCGSA